MRYSAACWDPLHDLLPPEVFVYGAQAVRRGRTTRTLRVTLPPAGPVDYRTPLLDAIARHDAASVARVLADDPAAVARAGWAGWTPLHHAARAGDAAVLALLVARPEAKAALNARIEDGRCPLMVALHHHHLAAAQVLLDAGAFVREAVLFGCVEDDNEAAVRYLLARDPDASCLDGESLLAASANGNAALVNLLLDCGLKCSAHSLHTALGQEGECITALLERGNADIHHVTPSGVTAAHVAAAFGLVSSLQALLAFDRTCALRATADGFSVLELAILGRRPEAVRVLLELQRLDGSAPFFDPRAKFKKDPDMEIVRLLVQGMEFDCSLTCTMQTPLHLARHCPPVQQLLREHGARICKSGMEWCTRDNIWQQFWHCRPCGIVGLMGVCVWCKDNAHAGHDVDGPYVAQFVCDGPKFDPK